MTSFHSKISIGDHLFMTSTRNLWYSLNKLESYSRISGGQAQVDGGRGPAPCGRPRRKFKLESTDVILSSSHAKKLAPFFTKISSLDTKKWTFFCDIN